MQGFQVKDNSLEQVITIYVDPLKFSRKMALKGRLNILM
jgi:hypothetical protein